MESKPRLLDLFCGAGGAAVGYHRAGFEVVGVDIKPQPNYPFEFVQGDALEVLRGLNENDRDDVLGPLRLERMSPVESRGEVSELVSRIVQHRSVEANHVGHSEPPVVVASKSLLPAQEVKGFDAIHASPPCQAYSIANNIHGRKDHPKLIEPTRELLRETGLPYVIENVPGAPLVDPVTVCGLSLGLNVKRHRIFESNVHLMVPPCHSKHDGDWLLVFGHTVLERGHELVSKAETEPGASYPIIRRKHTTTARGREAMGIDWMTRDELSEAIPPAYTELIGHQLMQHVKAKAVA